MRALSLAAAAGLAAALASLASAQGPPPPLAPGGVLRVCADPDNLPQSNSHGEGYENEIAAALARDLGRRLEYSWFPQRLGFVRNTLHARDETTGEFKCDVIIGVPRGYGLTATTRPYMKSSYALLLAERGALAALKSIEDLLQLPAARRATLRIGVFARTPGTDWVLQHGLIGRAVFYPTQSADPAESTQRIVEHDLGAGTIDAAILWGPIAGFLASRHAAGAGRAPGTAWTVLPFPPQPRIRFEYEMTMGVRFGEQAWKDTLDTWIGTHQGEIERILRSAHVPLQ